MAIDINLNSQYPVITPKTQVAIYEKHVQDTSSLKLVMPFVLPKQTNNIKYCPPVLDQQNQYGCSAFTVATMIEYYQLKNSKQYTPLSAEALYYWGRELGHNENTNIGVDPGQIFEVAKIIGIPPEKDDYNLPANQFSKPSSDAIKNALDSRIKSWKSLNIYDKNIKKSTSIAESLANGDIISAFVYMSNNLYNPPNSGIVDIDENKPSKKSSWHEIMIVDYKPNPEKIGEKLFLCQNSWGTHYGIQPEGANTGGFVWLTEDYIEQGCYFAATIEM